MQPFSTNELVGEVSTLLDVPYWTKRTLYPRKFGNTWGDQNTPEAVTLDASGNTYSFKPTPIGASLLNSIRSNTGKEILVEPVTQELQNEFKIPADTGGVYFPKNKEYGHVNPTTRKVFVSPERGTNAFVVAHEAGHAVDPNLYQNAINLERQAPAIQRNLGSAVAAGNPRAFLSSYVQPFLVVSGDEAFAQRFAADALNKAGIDSIGAVQDDWYKGYPANEVVKGIDEARDAFTYAMTGGDPRNPYRAKNANTFINNSRAVADTFLNLALDERYREKENELRQLGRQNIDRILGPYADVD